MADQCSAPTPWDGIRRPEDTLPTFQDPLPPQLLRIAHGLATELLRAVSDELSTTRAAAEAARQEARRVGEALDVLRGRHLADEGARCPAAAHADARRGVSPNSDGSRPVRAIRSDESSPHFASEVEPIETLAGIQTLDDSSSKAAQKSPSIEASGRRRFSVVSLLVGREQSIPRATVATCADLCAATEKLCLIGVLMLALVFEPLVDVEDDEHPLTPVYALALSCSAALSCFVVTFTVLECYYIHMTLGALSMCKSNTSFSVSFETILGNFQYLRQCARNSVWAALCLILVAAALHIGKHANESVVWQAVVLVSSGALVGGAVLVVVCVKRFRVQYRPLLGLMNMHM